MSDSLLDSQNAASQDVVVDPNILSVIVDVVDSIIVITDSGGNIQFVNHAFERAYGYSKSEVLGSHLNMLRSSLTGTDLQEDSVAAIQRGEIWAGEFQNIRADGSSFWVRETISPVMVGGAARWIVYVGRDLSRDHLMHNLQSEIEAMTDAGPITAEVMHDIRNYLAAIVGNATLAESYTHEPDSLTNCLADIRLAAEAATQLIYTRRVGKESPNKAAPSSQVTKAVERVVELASPMLRSRSIEIESVFMEDPWVSIEEPVVHKLLLALILNAQEAIGEHGAIVTIIGKSDSEAFVRVGDTGPGVPAGQLNDLFNPKVDDACKTERNSHQYRAVLPSCRALAREYGGDLTVESREGFGSTFTLSMPLAAGGNVE